MQIDMPEVLELVVVAAGSFQADFMTISQLSKVSFFHVCPGQCEQCDPFNVLLDNINGANKPTKLACNWYCTMVCVYTMMGIMAG